MLSSSLRSVLTSITSKSATTKTVQSMANAVVKNRDASLSTAKVAKAAAPAVAKNHAESRSVVSGKGYSRTASSSSIDSSRIFSSAAAGDCHMTGF